MTPAMQYISALQKMFYEKPIRELTFSVGWNHRAGGRKLAASTSGVIHRI
jgi:hypothetical protein